MLWGAGLGNTKLNYQSYIERIERNNRTNENEKIER